MKTIYTKTTLLLLQLCLACLLMVRVSAQDLYTGVWRTGSGGYALYGGLNWADFTKKWDTLNGKNLRLTDVSTYVKNGKRLYNGVWRNGTDGYGLYGGLEWDAFVDKWVELNGKNLRLVDIETYTAGGKRLYLGVWRGGKDGYGLHGGMEWNAFVDKWEELAKKNLRLIDVASYVSNGKRLYTGVWRGGKDGYALLNGLDWTSFVAKWEELAAQNLRLINISSYMSGNTRVYLGVWREGTDNYALWNGTDWESTVSKWAELGKANLRLINLETYESDCDDVCLNNVLMDDNPETKNRETYNYGITATTTHCEGLPGSCPAPGADDKVYYRWPSLKIGSTYYARNSALFSARDRIFTLPFNDAAEDMRHNGWLYSPGSWHHALDYSRKDVKTFKITASAPGTVIYIGWDNWSGNTMIISHDVGRQKDVYRTIYMHLRNGASNDCDKAWTNTVPALSGQNLEDYKDYLNSTGCPLKRTERSPSETNWGKESQTINMSLLGKKVSAGQTIAWAGSTGPGGCGCTGKNAGNVSSNTHLHIFFAHRDATDNKWYFFDPYGIYSFPTCYPAGVDENINTACARYPIAWKGGNPDYPTLNGLDKSSETETSLATDKYSKLFVSPNPSPGNISVKYNSIKAGKINMIVYDKSGMAVHRNSTYANAGDNIYKLNLSNLISGVYYIELTNDDSKIREKVIISK